MCLKFSAKFPKSETKVNYRLIPGHIFLFSFSGQTLYFRRHRFLVMDPKMEDVMFFAGRLLPDEDKVRLIDLVPGIEKYVKKLIINTEQDEARIGVAALVKRLPNLRKVVTKSPISFGDFVLSDEPPWVTMTQTAAEKRRRHRQVLVKLAEVNPRITAFEGFCKEAILDYIRCVKEHDPQYDAADVRKVFDGGYDDLKHFLQNFPDMKLKMKVQIWRPEHEDEFVQNGRRHLIHDLKLEMYYTIRSEFKSVRHLILDLPTSNLSSSLTMKVSFS